jgi:hypothetical protein
MLFKRVMGIRGSTKNELGVGLGLHKHDGGDEGHASGSVQEDELGIVENA